MTLGEAEPNPHILDWIEGSVSYFPSFLDDPYDSSEINWWDPNKDYAQDLIDGSATSMSVASTITTADGNTKLTPESTNPTTITNHSEESVISDSFKKRKASSSSESQDHTQQRNQSQYATENSKAIDVKLTKPIPGLKKAVGKKRSAVSSGNNGNNGNKEGRWAEQLLNPCAAAILANNLTRVQHLLYVLHELASPNGDPNHRLAFHGLRALTHHLSSSSSTTSPSSSAPFTFSSAEPRFFQKSLLKFNENSPWFAFPSKIANASILQLLGEEPDKSHGVHVLDIGVSHWAQWPTLLDGLSRQTGGPPPLVRITVISPATQSDLDTPFSMAPPGYDVSAPLIGFAESLNIKLQINRLDTLPLQNLTAQSINASPDETLIISAQFRLHHLSHHGERTEFLRKLRTLNPKGVILSENNSDCACASCVDFATGFSRRNEYLWRFLDSTSAAFKGRDSEERRMMEGEAAKALTSAAEMNEGRERWCERMREVGFVGEAFGEDAIDGGRALLRKHDGNWEMKAEEDGGGGGAGGSGSCVSLWWKGQAVSFCSLWKLSSLKE